MPMIPLLVFACAVVMALSAIRAPDGPRRSDAVQVTYPVYAHQ